MQNNDKHKINIKQDTVSTIKKIHQSTDFY